MKSGAGNRILVVDGLNYFANGTHILKGIELNADRGEFIGLIGPNGAGKTTLLKCINGIYKGDGRIEIAGMDTGRMSRRQILARLCCTRTRVTFPFAAMDIDDRKIPPLGRFRAECRRLFGRAQTWNTGTLELEKRPVNTPSGGGVRGCFLPGYWRKKRI